MAVAADLGLILPFGIYPRGYGIERVVPDQECVVFRRQNNDEVSPQEAARLRDQGAVLVDVREGDEWAAGHAPGAVHVPLGEVSNAASRFDGQQVLTVCRSGGRSAKAAEILVAVGVNVRDVAGGMTAWAEAGLPVVRDDGAVGAVA